MSKQEMYLISGEDLHQTIKKAMLDALKEHAAKQPEKEYTINQTYKILHRSWSTVKTMVKEGKLKTSRTGRITESSLRKFLDQQ